jgi:hypothetical protein
MHRVGDAMRAAVPLDGRVRCEIAHFAKKISRADLSIVQPDSQRARRIEVCHRRAPRLHPPRATLQRAYHVQASTHAGLHVCAAGEREIRLDVHTSFDGIV